MRRISVVIAILKLLPWNVAFTQPKIPHPNMQWWQDAKFGLFLHWGLYSVAGGDWNGHAYKGNEHFMLYEKIPWKVYGSTLAPQFNPVKFDADAWVKMAKNAGMKYIVITAKHHEGFAMFNSQSSDYNIVKMTPWGKEKRPDENACGSL
ncbi:MAG: alpha-L-fucosidase [Arachidicoccus sp.]|nr:alpha-L-fucosidase [Arachidicoccus sp.]